MAKDYSRAFYNGAKWKRTQAAFMASKNYVCERCGSPAKIVHHKTYLNPGNINDPSISLSWDNLEALCQECHNREHMGSEATADGLRFDQYGNLVKL